MPCTACAWHHFTVGRTTHPSHHYPKVHTPMKKYITPVAASIAAIGLSMSLTACGEKPDPAGPDVTGMSLPQAKAALKKAHVNTSVHADTLFGVLIESNFVVCDEAAINAHMVRL